MRKYRFKISARLRGALGVWSAYQVDVEAPSADAARLKLYETYEHISVHSVQELRADA